MKSKIVAITFLVLVFFSLFRLINRPVTDNDEGVYWTTFLLVNKGYPLYKETFFSHPPGFFWTTYPGFLLFGKTLQAARSMIFFWSITALLGIVWLLFQLKKQKEALLTVLILFSISTFIKQIITFQSDALALSFSTLALISLYRYIDIKKIKWIGLSGIFFTMAFWTKLDVSILIPLIILLINPTSSRFAGLRGASELRNLFLFFLSFVLTSLILVIPFGIKEIFNNVFILRIQSLAAYSFDPLKVFNLLKTDIVLSFLIIICLIFSIFLKSKVKSLKSIVFIWSIISFCSLFLYRPLFSHHLVFLTVPFALTFSLLINKFKRLSRSVLVIFVFLALFNSIRGLKKTDNSYLTNDQKMGVELIKKNTKPNDLVISDEGILNAASGRLPPPELVDISFVRIKSGNLSPEKFREIINKYKPKMILAWNGRLNNLKKFEELLGEYKKINYSNGKKAFIRVNSELSPHY